MFGLLFGLLGKKQASFDNTEEYRLTLGEHLDELRVRIIRVLVMLIVGWVAGWYILPSLYAFLNNMVAVNITQALDGKAPFSDVFRNATDPFMLKFRLSFMLGLIMVFPFCLLQIWGFIAPGLKPNERKPIERLAPWTLILFVMGAGFCWVIIPSALQWFAQYVLEFPGTGLMQEPGAMIFFVLKMMLAFGLGFQLPVVVYALGSIGLLKSETLLQYWRQWATAVFLAAAILTPSNDAFSMLMMAVPLVILFAISVVLVTAVQKKQKREQEKRDADEAYVS
ncbi:MAG: twin-arginine translocase subunit TatC [Fimbriimonas sp.]